MRSSSGSRRALIVLAPLLAYAGLTLLLFWPLLPQLGTGLHDRSDTTLNTWILAWQAHVLPRNPLALFAAPIFYPLRDALALSEILWPAAPIAVPLLAATGNPVLVYNLLFLAAFPLAGFGAYLLALWVAGCGFKVEGSAESFEPSTFNLYRLSAFLAGLIYAFSPHQFGHLSQLQLLSIAWLPLTLLFVDRFWIAGRPKDGVLFALCAVSQTLSAFYYGFQVALAVGLYLLVRLVTAPNRRTVHRLAALLPSIALAALLIAPFAVPYLRVRSELGLERSIGETLQNAATLAEYLRPSAANPLYRMLPGLASTEGGLFPGLIVLALAVLGVITWPRRRNPANLSSVVCRPSSIGRGYWLLLLFAAVILSLGPRLKLVAADPGGMTLPFAWLYAHVPGMTAIRAPGRFANTAFLALAVLAAIGAAWLLRRVSSVVGRRSSVVQFAVMGLLACVLLAEYAGGLGRFAVQPMPPTDGPLYAWLSAQPRAAIVELPLTSDMAGKPDGAAGSAATSAAEPAPWPDYNLLRYQYFQTGHWQPTVDGYSGFVPPHHRELGLAMAHFPDERSLTLLRGLGVERVIVHADLLDAFQPGRAAALRAALAQMPGVFHERDFGPEWVYRLLPEAVRVGEVAGRFWSAADGQAFLILSSTDGRDVVIPPGQPLRVRGSWQSAGDEAAQPFEISVQLPLMVGAGSIVPLDLPRPARLGATTLRLAAHDARFAVAPYERQATVKADANPVRVLAIQSGALLSQPDVSPSGTITLTLPWRLLDRPDADASVSARILDAQGQMVAQDDRALGGDVNLVRAWQPGMVVTTTHALRLPDAPGRYTFQAFIYRLDDPADYLFLDESGDPAATLDWPLELSPPR